MVKLSGFPLMLQAAVLDGVAFDPFSYHQDGLPAPEAKREQRGMWGGSFKEPWNYWACRRSKAGRLFGRLKLADKHLASVFHCIDDEIIGWLERRERRKRGRLAGSRQLM